MWDEPHFKEYMRRIRPNRPLLVDKLTDEMRKLKDINLIYPVGNGTYIHIMGLSGEEQKGFKVYRIIQPERPDPKAYELVEYAFSLEVADREVPILKDDLEKFIKEILDKIIEISDSPVDYSKQKPSRKVKVYKEDYDKLVYHFVRDHASTGFLEPFLLDPYIEDISYPGGGDMFIVHKLFGPLRVEPSFPPEEVEKLIVTLSEEFGKPITHSKPIVDASLPDGSRLNVVYGSDVSRKGTNITIRKFSKIPLSITQLINYGSIDERQAAYMWMMLEDGMNTFICGETASGKTTLMNALATFLPPSNKIITIEDTPEVTLPHSNWVSEVTRDTGNPDTSVTMFDLLKAALRQRPNTIIVGEIRGVEGNIAFQAMQTGHQVMSTFHAGSVQSLVQRLTGAPINVPKSHIDNLNIAVFTSAVRVKGRIARRVISINEIIGFNPAAGGLIYVPIFTWEPSNDTFSFRGKGSSYLIQAKILLRRGLSRRDEVKLYEEMELRAALLRSLVERKIFNYYDVWRVICKVHERGLEEVAMKFNLI